ncbi:YolD-like family protein [Metabacillus sediminilitoris]|uniref:YolD-like family protein n=1 Tax=Metabacillus sediminilitoris TaxID=2567941 RepID=A0A4S4C981_9BACI|nr:YolD-like family protein [Metabacillus sediminilitoris]QGQ45346.1 hypothetical protein GMB29_08790 [Metabacillus sediminilitoris]THF82356.1 YolD-like family protein [Metabacillus sediminilitoris]
MILKELSTNELITIDYYKEGMIKTCKAYVLYLNVNDQTLLIKDEQLIVYSIHLSGIKEILFTEYV